MTKKVWIILSVTLIVKCFLAATTELINDEVYYWTYPQHLQWCYFDHPAMIALLARLSTFNLAFQSEFFLRLGPMICGVGSGWLVYLIGKTLRDERAGLIALMLFIASPYSNLMAGWLLIPDAPQLLFWLWSIYLMIKIVQPPRHSIRNNLLLFGLIAGCCIYSKVSGVFLWFGFLLYVVLYKRELLKSAWLYVSGCISLIFVGIIFYWNETNQFITYSYHSNRVSFFSNIQIDGFFRELFGEAIYNNPISFCVIVISVYFFIKRKFILPSYGRLLLLNSLPLIAVVLFVALFRDTLPHWTGPAYSTLIPFAAVWVSERTKNISLIPRIVRASLIFTCFLLMIGIFLLHFSSFSIGDKSAEHLGKGDVTLDLSGFKKFGSDFDSLYEADKKSGIMKSDAFLLGDYWFPAAHVDYYVATPRGIPFLAIGGLNNIHHYAWLNRKRKFLQQGDDAYLVIVSNYFNLPSKSLVEQFDSVMSPVIIPQMRGQTTVRSFYIFRLKNYKGKVPTSGVLEDLE
jgi:hypothetical protein